MGKIGNQKTVLEAKANIKKTWEELLSEANVQDRDQELDYGFEKDENGEVVLENGNLKPIGLCDPYNPVTIVCLYIYQFQSFAYAELNRASRYKIDLKVKTLGPWAAALAKIIGGAQMSRSNPKDIQKYDCSKQ